MPFTDRFIRVPVDLYDNKRDEMIGYNDETKEVSTFCMINPFEISHYRPAVDDNDKLSETVVHLKSGESITCHQNIKEFETLLNNHNA